MDNGKLCSSFDVASINALERFQEGLSNIAMKWLKSWTRPEQEGTKKVSCTREAKIRTDMSSTATITTVSPDAD